MHIVGHDSEEEIDPFYVESLEHEFEVLEYLKGSDEDRIIGIVPVDVGMFYQTRLGAAVLGKGRLKDRDTRWDDREAIVFLEDNNPIIPSSLKPGRYLLGWFANIFEGYTVASRIDKRWLPAVSNTAIAMGSASQQFFTDDPEKEKYVSSQEGAALLEAPSTTAASLKARIAELEAEVNASDSPEEYRKCLIDGYRNERVRGTRGGRRPIPDYYERFDYIFGSGLPSGSVVYSNGFWGAVKYGEHWLEGRDKDLFVVSAPGVVVSARPLPEGEYKFYSNGRGQQFVLCDAIPDFERNRRELFVQVTAPSDTLHEAFFDPVEIGDAVGADGVNGVLKPAAFSVNSSDDATTIERIDWQDNAVSIAISDAPALANHHIDFIALDGSVALRLDFDHASVSDEGSTRTLRWKVCEQPWQSGDLLMLRISESEDDLTGVTNDTACDGDPTATPEPTATATAEPKPEPTATAEPTATVEPTATPTPTVLLPPQNLTAEATHSSVTLRWDAPTGSAPIDGYRILRRAQDEREFTHIADTSAETADTSAETAEYLDTADISPSAKYIYRMRSFAADGSTSEDVRVEATTA